MPIYAIYAWCAFHDHKHALSLSSGGYCVSHLRRAVSAAAALEQVTSASGARYLARLATRAAVYSLWHYPSMRLDPHRPRFHGASCPMESGLSSNRLAPASDCPLLRKNLPARVLGGWLIFTRPV